MIALVVVALLCASAGAASADDGPTVENLRTPDAPAFVLLGVAPTQVERPTEPSALAVSVLSAAAGADNLIPQNYALQVAPYWLVSHPSLTAGQYFRPSIRQGFLDTLSVSVVSSRTSTVRGVKADANEIGIGARTGIVVGHASPALERQLVKLHALQYANNVAMGVLQPYLQNEAPPPDADLGGQKLSELIAMVRQAFAASAGSNDSPEQRAAYTAAERTLEEQLNALWADAHRPASQQALRAGADAIAARLEAQLDATVKSIQVKDDDRRGFGLSLAAASAWLVPDATSSERKLTRWGVWATPSYRPDVAPIEVIGLVRASHRPEAGGDTTIDVGGRATHQAGALNWSFEYIERMDRAAGASRKTSERLAAVFDVRLRDDVYVTVSYGKDFADPFLGDPKGGILTSIGLSFDFGDKPSISLK